MLAPSESRDLERIREALEEIVRAMRAWLEVMSNEGRGV